MLPTLKNNTIEFVRLSRLYAVRQPALPALAAYPTLDALVAALAGPTRADEDTRRRLVCAVLVDYQAVPSPLGPAIALHAFRGMLLRLSKSLHGVDDSDDADARVTVGLLEALRHVHPERDPAGIGLRVRQETRRAVFAVLKREALARPPRPGDEEEEEPTPRAEAPPGEDGAVEEEEEARPPDDDPQGNRDAASEEGPRDPMRVKAAARCLDPDALADAESLVPFEDRLVFHNPTAANVPVEHLLRAHGVRGGLRRLTNHLFAHVSERDRENVYRQLWRRTQRLLAESK